MWIKIINKIFKKITDLLGVGRPTKDYLKSFFIKDYYFKIWFENNKDAELQLDYPLDGDSIFFELGGFVGDYSSKIVEKYNPKVYIFEPKIEHFRELERKFKDNKKINIYNLGLSDSEETAYINELGESSFITNTNRAGLEKIELIKLSNFIIKENLEIIDLININIEGSEYKVLNNIIDSKIISKIKFLQIQFHKNIPFSAWKRYRIQKKLSKTHKLIWNYSFVWERWDIKEPK